MKVIEYGHQRIRCNKCFSLLQFDIWDVQRNEVNDAYFVNCPVCSKNVSVPALEVYQMTSKEDLDKNKRFSV